MLGTLNKYLYSAVLLVNALYSFVTARQAADIQLHDWMPSHSTPITPWFFLSLCTGVTYSALLVCTLTSRHTNSLTTWLFAKPRFWYLVLIAVVLYAATGWEPATLGGGYIGCLFFIVFYTVPAFSIAGFLAWGWRIDARDDIDKHH